MILGVGYNSDPVNCPRSVGGIITQSYIVWNNMLIRCYSNAEHTRYPRYRGCSVIEEWKDYKNFKQWFDAYEYKSQEYHLDKDLLLMNNKVYSSDKCVFLPPQLNTILIKSNSIRGKYPVGVVEDKRRGVFEASCRVEDRKTQFLGYYKTPEEAFSVYKIFKEAHIKEVTNDWVASGKVLDPRAYQALVNYEINITD